MEGAVVATSAAPRKRYELTRCNEAPDSFVLRILWDSHEDPMQGFRKSEEFKPFFAAVKPFLGAIQEMNHYQLTDLQWRRSG
jgi:quinol monooxygenase YgiN